MKPSRKVAAITAALFIACLTASILVLQRVDQVRRGATLQEFLYISSPKAAKRLSLGYTGLMADLYWTRAVQYFGGHHARGDQEYQLLGPLLEITTHLDPQLLVAYEYGSNFLAPARPSGAGEPERAVNLVKFGIQNNPKEWRLYYDLGFIYYMELKDYSAAAEAFRQGSTLPNAHPFMPVIAATMATHAGDIEMARMMWRTTYESGNVERSVKANAVAHLRALQVDEDVINLEKAIAAFKAQTGQYPSSFLDLRARGMANGLYPADPLGHPYKFMPDGRIEVSRPDDLPFITKGTPTGYQPPPPKFLPTD
jgi:tetratricopeptide (TPR) repeat protein